MTAAIRVQDLGKCYQVRQAELRGHYRTLRETITEMALAPIRRWRNGAENGHKEEFWALRDVCFDIEPGEVVGIIGRNGAGKSTLLKILSQITKPSHGEVQVRGRVSSLLEVGTGFHPELTGRENIYLNGSILGMTRREIVQRFDEIVAFAEIDQFLDTPVKRYSSGMYVRLAFAVAAHLQPEVLLVDEVLAVGDAMFQKKCLGKMREVGARDRAVLFVSHNMAAVQSLCTRGIVLDRGRVVLDGPIQDAVSAYLSSLRTVSNTRLGDRPDHRGSGELRVIDVEISNLGNPNSDRLATGQAARFMFRLDRPVSDPQVSFGIFDHYGHFVADFDSRNFDKENGQGHRKSDVLVCHVEELTLVPGEYRMNIAVWFQNGAVDYIESAAIFEVEEGLLRGLPVRRGTKGTTVIPHRWALP
jgi:homopolymeric O-antigen transport system ATP-binding protein